MMDIQTEIIVRVIFAACFIFAGSVAYEEFRVKRRFLNIIFDFMLGFFVAFMIIATAMLMPSAAWFVVFGN